MAGLRVHFVMPAELVERIDGALVEGQSRGEFVRRAVERKLAAIDREPVHHFSWLAGFIDGEGCFMIAKSSGSKGAYRFQMSIRLRNDDAALLEALRDTVGAGTVITNIVRTASVSANAKPQALWAVSSREDVAKVIAILDDHPLRSKKARDYAIWREAVQLWLSVPKGSSADWEAIGVLHDTLRAVRAYPGECEDAEQALGVEMGDAVSPKAHVRSQEVAPPAPAPAEQPSDSPGSRLGDGSAVIGGTGRSGDGASAAESYREQFHGPSLARSSVQAKRDVRPIPKKGEK